MFRKILILIGIPVGLLMMISAISVNYLEPNEQVILDFIKDNPNKSAIHLLRDDTLIAESNSDKIMPLASTVKIIVAIEYAIQASNRKINPDQKIHIEELDKFYVSNTDGGAHPAWLKSIDNKIVDDQVTIREIAKGMIRYSSNANTEWLCHSLGLENINNRLDSLGITDHTDIYHIVSALFVGKEAFPNIKGEELETKLRALDIDGYIETTNKVHSKLLSDTMYRKDVGDLGFNIQRIWSDNLPGSTVREYAQLMKKLNSKSYLDADTHTYLDEVMEGIMENPANQTWLEHSGTKGGSTAYVLTKALYATDKKGHRTELAYFFNDINFFEMLQLQASINQFELKILTSKEFRAKIADALKC